MDAYFVLRTEDTPNGLIHVTLKKKKLLKKSLVYYDAKLNLLKHDVKYQDCKQMSAK